MPGNNVDGLKKGTLFLLAGQAVSLVAGYGIHVWLARTLGPGQYGIYGVVMSLLLWIEVGVISGIPMAVQKFVSAAPDKAGAVIKKTAGMQVVYIVVLFSASFVLAPLVASLFRHAEIAGYLRIALIDLWVYGIYFIFLNLQNGLHNFRKQAALILLYSASKFIFVVLLVPSEAKLSGAFIANIAASAVALCAALLFAAKREGDTGGQSVSGREILQFAAPVAFFALAINLYLNIDLWIVKYFLGDVQAGMYVSAATVARVPYFLFFALSSAVLPLLSRALAKGETESVQNTIAGAVKFLIIAVTLLVAVVAGYGKEIIVLLFSETFSPAGEIVSLLIAGMSFLALFFLFTTVFNADNRPRTALVLTGSGVVLDAVLAIVLIPDMGVMGGALATTLSLVAVTIVSWSMVRSSFGTFFTAGSAARIGGAGLLVYGAARVIRVSGILMVATCAALALGYLAALIAVREISPRDLYLFKKKG